MRMREKCDTPEIYMELSNDPFPRPAKDGEPV
jgi:hypothetical protein